jgi:anaerobic selenocysteine-containing dehydrogenase
VSNEVNLINQISAFNDISFKLEYNKLSDIYNNEKYLQILNTESNFTLPLLQGQHGISVNKIDLDGDCINTNTNAIANSFTDNQSYNLIYAINICNNLFNSQNDIVTLSNDKNIAVLQTCTSLDNIKESVKFFDFILPSVNNLEKNSSFINIFGYLQRSRLIIFPPKNARADHRILFIFAKLVSKLRLEFKKNLELGHLINTFINDFNLVSAKNKMIQDSYHIPFINYYFVKQNNKIFSLLNVLYMNKFTDFYLSTSVSKASTIMLKCSLEQKRVFSNFI